MMWQGRRHFDAQPVEGTQEIWDVKSQCLGSSFCSRKIIAKHNTVLPPGPSYPGQSCLQELSSELSDPRPDLTVMDCNNSIRLPIIDLLLLLLASYKLCDFGQVTLPLCASVAASGRGVQMCRLLPKPGPCTHEYCGGDRAL